MSTPTLTTGTFETLRSAASGLTTASGLSTEQALTFALFAVFVAVTLGITFWARATTSGADDYYAGGRGLSGLQNGFALAGDYMSAASFLGIAGMIALFGQDGFLYSLGFFVGWLPVLLLVGLIRNAGRFTMGDVLAHRMRQPPVRIAAAVSTMTVTVFYLLAQMVGAGALISLLLGITPGGTFLGVSADAAENVTIIAVGVLMIFYVAFGGMKATTWVQIVKAVLLVVGAVVMGVLVLAHFGFDLSSLLAAAADPGTDPADFRQPGTEHIHGAGGVPHQDELYHQIDFISLALALVLGTVALPHIVARFFTVPDANTARRSVNWAIGLVGVFYLTTLALGLGASALVGRSEIVAQDPGGNTAVLQLARVLGDSLGGAIGADIALAVVGAISFATILAVVAGLVMAASSSLAHDVFGHVLMLGRPRESQEVAIARLAAFLVGTFAIFLAVFAKNINVAFLVGLAFAVAASANLPALVLSLLWSRFNTTGAVWGVYGGLAGSLVLVVLSPVTSGKIEPVTGRSLALFPAGVDFHVFPLENPGLVSIPFGFLCAIVGTLLGKEKSGPDRFAELSVRSLTGVGAH